MERKGEGFSCQLQGDIALVDSLNEGLRVELWVKVGVIVVVLVVLLLVVIVVVEEVVVVVALFKVVVVVVVVVVVLVVVVVVVTDVVVVAILLKVVIVVEVVVLVDVTVLAVVGIEFEEDVVKNGAVLLVGVGSSARLELPKSGSNGCRKGGVNMSCQLQAPILVVLDFRVVLLVEVISLF